MSHISKLHSKKIATSRAAQTAAVALGLTLMGVGTAGAVDSIINLNEAYNSPLSYTVNGETFYTQRSTVQEQVPSSSSTQSPNYFNKLVVVTQASATAHATSGATEITLNGHAWYTATLSGTIEGSYTPFYTEHGVSGEGNDVTTYHWYVVSGTSTPVYDNALNLADTYYTRFTDAIDWNGTITGTYAGGPMVVTITSTTSVPNPYYAVTGTLDSSLTVSVTDKTVGVIGATGSTGTITSTDTFTLSGATADKVYLVGAGGSVSGDAALTLSNSSSVADVYGGSKVDTANTNATAGNVSIDVKAGSNITDKLVGGGSGSLGSSTTGTVTITVANSTLNNVYSGGESSGATIITGAVSYSQTNGTIANYVGGAYTYNSAEANATVDSVATTLTDTSVSGTTVLGAEAEKGSSTVTNAVTGTLSGDTFSGGLIGGAYASGTGVKATAGSVAVTDTGSTIGTTSIHADYVGGGVAEAGAATKVTNAVSSKMTDTTLNGNAIGGGKASGTNSIVTVGGPVDITIDGASTVEENLIGGGIAEGTNSKVEINNGVTTTMDTTSSVKGDVIGGVLTSGTKSSGTVIGDSIVDLNQGTVYGNVYAGGRSDTAGAQTTVQGDATVNMTGASVNVYSGDVYGRMSYTSSSDIEGTATFNFGSTTAGSTGVFNSFQNFDVVNVQGTDAAGVMDLHVKEGLTGTRGNVYLGSMPVIQPLAAADANLNTAVTVNVIDGNTLKSAPHPLTRAAR